MFKPHHTFLPLRPIRWPRGVFLGLVRYHRLFQHIFQAQSPIPVTTAVLNPVYISPSRVIIWTGNQTNLDPIGINTLQMSSARALCLHSNDVAILSANGGAAFNESCAPIGLKYCDISQYEYRTQGRVFIPPQRPRLQMLCWQIMKRQLRVTWRSCDVAFPEHSQSNLWPCDYHEVTGKSFSGWPRCMPGAGN